MTRLAVAAFMACVAVVADVSTAMAAPADSTILYTLLTPRSALEYGCFGPCECPVNLLPTYGSFVLVPTGVDPLYAHYAVQNYICSFNNGPGAVAITGSGTYRIGGEVAAMQQLTLDLVVEGRPVQHFDSGLVPTDTPFPQILASCALHGFACEDSVVTVYAQPAATTGVPPLHPGISLSARPNPFRRDALIAFTLPRPQPFALTVVDLGGRRVRALSQGSSAGNLQTVTWDGRRDDGRMAPAGVYWVILRCADGVDRRAIVKLD